MFLWCYCQQHLPRYLGNYTYTYTLDQVTCKSDASPEQVEAAKKHARDQGGKITHEYSLIKGFA